jgi:hypothetical protein
MSEPIPGDTPSAYVDRLIADAVRREREAVVARLRDRSAQYRRAVDRSRDVFVRELSWGLVDVLSSEADAIERGDHHGEPTP